MNNASDWLSSFRDDKADSNNLFPRIKAQKISITAGKGGVGKTSITVKLARDISAQGKKVLVIDCDYNLSNTAIKLGLPIDNTFYYLLTAQKDFVDCLYKEDSFHLLSACNGSLELFDSQLKFEEIIIDIINAHEHEYDYIFLDCPAGLNKESLILNAYSDSRYIVVTPDRSSITDSYSLIKLLANKYNIYENDLIVNMYSGANQYSKIVKTISETAENFLNCRTRVLGGIRKASVDIGDFDSFFLKPGKSNLHQDMAKLISKITDSSNTSQLVMENAILHSSNGGQEVQIY